MALATLLPEGLLLVTPLQIEGLATGLLFMSGLCYVWLIFVVEDHPITTPG